MLAALASIALFNDRAPGPVLSAANVAVQLLAGEPSLCRCIFLDCTDWFDTYVYNPVLLYEAKKEDKVPT